MTMKEENEITQEVKELLDSLEQHGQNARRQKELSDLIDGLEASSTKHRKLYPLWWIVGAAAACLLLWLLAKPAMEETPNMNEEILVEEIGVKDTIQEKNETIKESVVLEEPIIPEKLMAEEMPVKATIQKPKVPKPTPKNIEEPILSENTIIETTEPEPTNTSNVVSNPIPNVIDEPNAVQSPQRRVVRSLNLVCYECQKEPEYVPQAMIEDRTIFGQLQDPNMKNGSWAFEVKLY